MKLKLDSHGHAVLNEGRPVYVRDDGTEMIFDAVKSAEKVKELNAEAKMHREAKEAALAKLEERALQSGDTEAQAKIAELTQKLSAAEGKLGVQLIDAAFAGSKILSEQIAVPADLIRAQFGSHFRVENDKVVAFDRAGNKITSKDQPGMDAGFDEALQHLLDGYPHRDAILRGRSGGTNTNTGNSSGGGMGHKVMTRSEFDQMPMLERQRKVCSGWEVVDG